MAEFRCQAGLDIAPFGRGRATLGEPAVAGLVEKGVQALAEGRVLADRQPFLGRQGWGETGTCRERGDLPLEKPSLALALDVGSARQSQGLDPAFQFRQVIVEILLGQADPGIDGEEVPHVGIVAV